jgi:NADPH oxidase 5
MLYIIGHVLLATYIVIYRLGKNKSHVLVVIARTTGMLLNVNCALIVILMLKHSILLIRTNRLLRRLIPVDDHIEFHKFVGRVITCLAFVHSIAHMANFGRLTGKIQ